MIAEVVGMIRNLETIQILSFIIAWVGIIAILMLVILDYKAQKVSKKKASCIPFHH